MDPATVTCMRENHVNGARRAARVLASSLTLLLAAPCVVTAQVRPAPAPARASQVSRDTATTATITGVVQDSGGAVVSGASVRVASGSP